MSLDNIFFCLQLDNVLVSVILYVSRCTANSTVMDTTPFHQLPKCEMIAKIDTVFKPKILLILSGKRKCGKDFLEQIIVKHFDSANCVSFRISAPIKSYFSKMHQLDYGELLKASNYKEQYRNDMVKWSEQLRASDPHCFLREAIFTSTVGRNCPIWILNDARRITDLEYFDDHKEIDMSNTKIIKIRVQCCDTIRAKRDWIFEPGIDDQTTECGLDHYKQWDYLVINENTTEDLMEQLKPMFEQIATSLQK